MKLSRPKLALKLLKLSSRSCPLEAVVAEKALVCEAGLWKAVLLKVLLASLLPKSSCQSSCLQAVLVEVLFEEGLGVKLKLCGSRS